MMPKLSPMRPATLLVLLSTLTLTSVLQAQSTCENCTLSFNAESLTPVEMSCSEGDPLLHLPNFPAFTSTCTAGYWASIFKYTVGAQSECTGTRPVGLASSFGSIHLGDFTATGLATTNKFNETEEGLTWTVYPENVARLQGTVANANNVTAQFEVDLYFNQAQSGADWTASGGNVNDGAAGPGDVNEWTIWQIKPHISKLVGQGSLAGHTLYLTTSNVAVSYPFQEGGGANGIDNGSGLGGTFDWTTCVGSTIYGGYGLASSSLAGCQETSSICASEHDAVAQFFIGNLRGFDQIEGTVNVTDDTPPVLDDLPPNYTLNCPVELAVLDAEHSVTTTDDCSTATLAIEESFENGDCPSEFTRTRIYTATDGCGLTSAHTQTVVVVDEVAPVLTVPSNATFSCSEGPTYTAAVASDACDGNIAVTEGEPIIVDGDCPGEYTVHRSFSATDLCGNTSTGAQVIHIQDLTPPVLAMPADVILPCGSSFVYPPATATDDCTDQENISISIFNSLPPTNCPEEYILERRFLATDLCGNSTLEIQTVTVTDNDLPYFTFVPADASYSCDEEPVLENATADDDCSSFSVTTTIDTVSAGCTNNYDLVRSFVVVDACGNFAEAQQTISIRDTTPPTWLVSVEDEVVECDEIWNPIALDAEDNCSLVSWETTIDTLGTPSSGSYSLAVTHSASDECGNASQLSQTITVVDTTPPSFVSVPADGTISCEDDIPFEMAVATDACSAVNVSVSDNLELEVNPGEHLFTRTFTATDTQGNSSTATQLISIVDNTAPTFTSFPDDYTVECSDVMPLDDAAASDNCGEVTIEVSSETTPGDAAGNYVIVRTFTATDDAGNSTSTTQTITVQDTTAPELTFVPADYTVECSDEMPMDDASASDNCGEVTIEVSSEITQGDAAGNYVIARTFTATDDAGNSTSATQTITVQDTTAPEFTFVPADYTVECAEEMPMDDAAAVDNCGEITIEVSSEITQGDAAGNYTITRTFTVTDDAGNSSSATQIVTVQDTTAPEFVYTPADALVECTDAWPTEVPEIVDACGSFVLELTTDTLAGLCGDLVVVKRTYLATDDAGNASAFIQTLTQIDTQGPVFDVVDEVDLSCSQNLSAVPIPTATDLCSEVTTLIWNDVEYSGGCTLPISALLRTYTAIDACGNVSQAEQVINLVDSQAPTWTFLPEDVTLECTDVYELLPAVATDNCAEPEVTWTVDTLGVVSNGVYDLVFDFIAVDDCDNIAEHQHVVHVTDTTAPDWVTFPEDHTMTCEGELDDSMPTALDACSDSVTLVLVSQEWTEGECEGSGQWVRTFSATDWNGNIQESSQMILVVDETPPAFTSIPEDATLECDEDLPNVLATAVDNCSAVTVTFDDNIEFGEGLGNFVVSRMFTATDACGNTTSAVQTFHVLDTTAPEFTFVPEGYAVECSEEMPLEEATATDNCGVVTIDVMSDTIQGDAAGNYTVVRTFTAMDDAGNSTSASQTIVVQDTTPPMLTLPEDYTVECSADMAMEDAIATDNCGAVVVTLTTDTVLGNASGNYEIRRTFTAVDDAGNSTSSTQTITVEDTTPPVVVLPSDTTVTCDAVIPVWEPVSEDNCGSTSWESTDEVLTGACSGESTILRHYVITDDAGNETGGTQTITVADDVAPTFTFVPESAIWECNAPTEIDSAAAVDNCSAVTLTAHLDTLDALVANQWILLVTWTAEDACGNFSEATQEIQVLDQLPPTIDLGPADATLPWGEALLLDVWESELVYSDSCSDLSALTVSVHIDTLEASMACVDEVVLTWIVTDLAGNEALWMQHVNLMDNDAPAWAYEPSDFTLSCDELWEPVFPEGSDHNAFSDTVVMDTILGNCTNHYTHVWTLTAEDICGNATEPWVLNVTYVDTVAPEIVSWPEDLMLMNASEVPECQSGLVTWTDICSLATDSCFTDTVEVYCPGSFLLARTFMVTDECGNAAAVEQSILVEDVEPPTWSYFPESMTVSCDSLVDAITVDDLQVVDNASGEDDILKEWIESVNNGDNCVWNDTHTYRATDGCGNATELTSYVVEFVDDTPPSLTLPLEQLDLLCVSEIPSCEETGVDAVDDCNDWSFICSDAFEGGGCTGPDCTLIRTITVTDACGNPADFEQIITVVEPPTVPELPTGFSPNNDSYNDVYQIRNAGPDLGIPPCDWLDNTALTVFDRWGSVVYTSEDVSIPWDGTNLNGRPLPVGTYFVVFEANGLTYRETVDLRR